jgi:ubiquitin C-terminal hydrolase
MLNEYVWIIPNYNHIVNQAQAAAQTKAFTSNNLPNNQYNIQYYPHSTANVFKLLSPNFDLHGYVWRLLWYPLSHHAKDGKLENPGIFLELLGKFNGSTNDPKLSRCSPVAADFRVVIEPANQQGAFAAIDRECRQDSFHQGKDRGWEGIMESSNIPNYLRQYQGIHHCGDAAECVHDGCLIIKLFIELRNTKPTHANNDLIDLSDSTDSFKPTNSEFVGLQNQGSTCYMNSLLQTLYHIPIFRAAVYAIDTQSTTEQSKDGNSNSIVLSLQKLFYLLQIRSAKQATLNQNQTADLTGSNYNNNNSTNPSNLNNAVETKELTNSFGWAGSETFQQHDIQEFSRLLIDAIHEKEKKNTKSPLVQSLFRGRYDTVTQCTDISLTSRRDELFLDLSLDVKGLGTLENSLRKYTESERLTGDNQYRTELHGKQNADRRIEFLSFPPILQIQLKRFDYDGKTNKMKKINEEFVFAEKIDLTELEKGPQDGEKGPAIYYLHSVLVHRESGFGGHYYSFIKPMLQESAQRNDGDYLSKTWFKFDDSFVAQSSAQEALNSNYGCDKLVDYQYLGKIEKKIVVHSHSAYMLVYLRQVQIARSAQYYHQLVHIPPHLRTIFEHEISQQAAAAHEKATAHLWTAIPLLNELELLKLQQQPSFYSFARDLSYCHWSEQHSIPLLQMATPQRQLRVMKVTTALDISDEINKINCSIPSAFLQLWSNLGLRASQFYRSEEFAAHYDLQSVHNVLMKAGVYCRLTLFDSLNGFNMGAAKIYSATDLARDRILLKMKFFDQRAEKLLFLGSALFFPAQPLKVAVEYALNFNEFHRVHICKAQQMSDFNYWDVNLIQQSIEEVNEQSLSWAFSDYVVYQEIYSPAQSNFDLPSYETNKIINTTTLQSGSTIIIAQKAGAGARKIEFPVLDQTLRQTLPSLRSCYNNAYESNETLAAPLQPIMPVLCQNPNQCSALEFLQYFSGVCTARVECNSIFSSITKPLTVEFNINLNQTFHCGVREILGEIAAVNPDRIGLKFCYPDGGGNAAHYRGVSDYYRCPMKASLPCYSVYKFISNLISFSQQVQHNNYVIHNHQQGVDFLYFTQSTPMIHNVKALLLPRSTSSPLSTVAQLVYPIFAQLFDTILSSDSFSSSSRDKRRAAEFIHTFPAKRFRGAENKLELKGNSFDAIRGAGGDFSYKIQLAIIQSDGRYSIIADDLVYTEFIDKLQLEALLKPTLTVLITARQYCSNQQNVAWLRLVSGPHNAATQQHRFECKAAPRFSLIPFPYDPIKSNCSVEEFVQANFPSNSVLGHIVPIKSQPNLFNFFSISLTEPLANLLNDAEQIPALCSEELNCHVSNGLLDVNNYCFNKQNNLVFTGSSTIISKIPNNAIVASQHNKAASESNGSSSTTNHHSNSSTETINHNSSNPVLRLF